MHRNPVKRGLVEKPEDWAWSSFRHYAIGEACPVEIESECTGRRRKAEAGRQLCASSRNANRIEVPVNQKRIMQILSLVIAFIFFVNAHPTFARASASQRQVVRAIQVFRSAKGVIARDNAARQLRNVVLAADPRTIDDETIHAIASLLQAREESIRYWIAEALGHFGARAKFAVPKLRTILDERECVIGGWRTLAI